ncbi:MAG TPA: hypothetical protein VHL11_11340 [Phototrophicaceae bacterium]|jgi:hypothetical protein|nr:hypothetical protein [Phototrophicaceae bacterium]
MRHPVIFDLPEEPDPNRVCPHQEIELLRWWLVSLMTTILSLLLLTGLAFLLLTHTLPLYFALFAGVILLLVSLLTISTSHNLWRVQPVPQAVAVSYIVGENGELIPQVESDSAIVKR